ncbi:hypothetical protein D3OALGA1CA_4873 [Olavius algarvensis associated proteobacterium Delta 3]|nr:hypothetical protein D3OALGB2SA_729 [Olavius algarvensis associated proteobacterium Delta 3]CAB5158171.1 hypothetical protein D3OALGA1CA_4873 [Olavius algarvensis associated proteobacterium Delta 3]
MYRKRQNYLPMLTKKRAAHNHGLPVFLTQREVVFPHSGL